MKLAIYLHAPVFTVYTHCKVKYLFFFSENIYIYNIYRTTTAVAFHLQSLIFS